MYRFARWTLLFALLVTITACGQGATDKGVKVENPPDIPPPPGQEQLGEQSVNPDNVQVRVPGENDTKGMTDQLLGDAKDGTSTTQDDDTKGSTDDVGLGVNDKRLPQLKESLKKAVSYGVLQANQTGSLTFHAKEPVTRRELFVALAKAFKLSPYAPKKPTFRDINDTDPDYELLEALVKNHYIPATDLKGKPTSFMADRFVTREFLCWLYARVKWIGERQKSPYTEISDTVKQFKDFEEITPADRAKVSVAYENEMLADVFGLDDEMLTQEHGLQPSKKINRAEMLLFLERYME